MPDETTATQPAPPQAPAAAPAPPAPAPASAPDVADVDPEIPPTPAGWPDKAWRQFHAQRKETAAARAAAKAASEEVAALKESHATELAAVRREAERGLAWSKVAVDGSPLAHPDVRRVVERSYDDAHAGATEAPPFAEWLTAHAPKSPVLAPYFAAVATQTPAGAAPPKPAAPPVQTDAGARQTVATTTNYTPEQRRAMRASGAWTPNHEEAYKQELSRRTGVKF